MSKKKQPEQAETEQTEAKQASEEKTEQPAEAKTPAADWEAKYNDLNDRYLRMAAEYDNFRKRSQREREQAYTDAVEALIFDICFHEFPREFVCELKSLYKSVALKLVERPLFAGADYLSEAGECLMVAVKTLFPTRNVNHILLFCVLSYYF